MGSDAFKKLTLAHNKGMPLLGFFTNSSEDKRFISDHNLDPGTLKNMSAILSGWKSSLKTYILACRNGQVLLCTGGHELAIWDPIRNIHMHIGSPPIHRSWFGNGVNGAILCARQHGGSCANCHSCNFLAICVTTNSSVAQVHRYSSVLGVWENWRDSAAVKADIDNRPATIIGDIFYWPTKSNYIIAFNNQEKKLKQIECPQETQGIFRRNLHIIQGHGGGVGLVGIRDFTLLTWSSAISSSGDHEWTCHTEVNLATLLALDTTFPYKGRHALRLLCTIEDTYMVVVWAKEGVFQIDLSNMKWKRFSGTTYYFPLYPYTVPPGQCSHSYVICALINLSFCR